MQNFIQLIDDEKPGGNIEYIIEQGSSAATGNLVPKDVYSPPLTPLGKNNGTNSKLFSTLAPSPELLPSGINSPVLQRLEAPSPVVPMESLFQTGGGSDYYTLLFQQQTASLPQQGQPNNINSSNNANGSLQPQHPISPVSYASITGGIQFGSPDLAMLRAPTNAIHSPQYIVDPYAFLQQSTPISTTAQGQHHPQQHSSVAKKQMEQHYHNRHKAYDGNTLYAAPNSLDYGSGSSASQPLLLVNQPPPFTDRLYRCSFKGCDKTFEKLTQLRSHTKIHSVEKPFACDSCNMRFSRNHDLKRHQRIHTGIRPYVCENCGKSFIRLDALSRHLKVNNGRGCKSRPAPKHAENSVETLMLPLHSHSFGGNSM